MVTNRVLATVAVSAFFVGAFAAATVKPPPPPPRVIIHDVPGPTRTVSRETQVMPDSCRSALEAAKEMRSALRVMHRDPELQRSWLDRAYKAVSLHDVTSMNEVTQELRDYRADRLGVTLDTLTAFQAYDKFTKECLGEAP